MPWHTQACTGWHILGGRREMGEEKRREEKGCSVWIVLPLHLCRLSAMPSSGYGPEDRVVVEAFIQHKGSIRIPGHCKFEPCRQMPFQKHQTWGAILLRAPRCCPTLVEMLEMCLLLVIFLSMITLIQFGVSEIEICSCRLSLLRDSKYFTFWWFKCYLPPVSPLLHVL